MDVVRVTKHSGSNKVLGKTHKMRVVMHPTISYHFIHKTQLEKTGNTPMPMPPGVSISQIVLELGMLVAVGWVRLRVAYRTGIVVVEDVYVVDDSPALGCPRFSELILVGQNPHHGRAATHGQRASASGVSMGGE